MKRFMLAVLVGLLILQAAPVRAAEPTPPPDGQSGTTSAEQPSEDSAWQWIAAIDKFFAPAFAWIGKAISAGIVYQVQSCGIVDGGYRPSSSPIRPAQVSDQPSLPEMAWALGQSLGSPVAYMRALKREGVDVLFINVLVGFVLAAVIWVAIIQALIWTIMLAIAALKLIISVGKFVLNLIRG
jgi:hypothetical protein